MRRALLALGIAAVAALGLLPAANSLAAYPQHISHLHTAPTSIQSAIALAPARWTMVKPIIPVTTQMVTPDNDVTGDQIVQLAMRYVGYPYTLTGNRPDLGFSCIGFVSYVYDSLGIPLPDELGNARAYAPAIGMGDLRAGDILWFGNTVWPGLSHVGIYLGGGRFVHAAWFTRGVIVSSLQNDPVDKNYWIAHYLGASRPWGHWVTPAEALPTTLRPVPGVPAVLVTVPALNMHRWWSLDAPVRQIVTQATPLTVLQRSGRWYHVMTPDGLKGWVTSAPANNSTAAVVTVAVEHRAVVHRSPVRVWHQTVRKTPTHHRATAARKHALRTHRATRVTHRAALHRKPRLHIRPARRWTWIRRWERATVLIRVHTRPRVSSAVARLVGPGRSVRVVARSGSWKRIRLAHGRFGYVYGAYVR